MVFKIKNSLKLIARLLAINCAILSTSLIAQELPTGSSGQSGIYFTPYDKQNYIRALNFASNGDKFAARAAMEIINDKLLVPIIERELLLKRTDIAPQELQNWLEANSEVAKADLVYNRATSLFPDIHFEKPAIYSSRRNFARIRAAKEIRSGHLNGQNNQDKAVLTRTKTLFDANADYDVIAVANQNLNSPIIGYQAWYGGLSAYRIGEFEKALLFFTSIASLQNADESLKTAAAFWAARTANKLGLIDTENSMLEQASLEPLSFYGQLAMQKLGKWQSISIPNQHSEFEKAKEIIANNKGAKRAIALFDIGLTNDAQIELTNAWNKSPPAEDLGFLFIAQSLGFKELGQRISEVSNVSFIANNYPIIQNLTPQGDSFVLDRALIFAIMRQESRFDANAISHAGARGLMQLMPSTAAWMTGRSEFKTNPSLLHDHRLNLSLGEAYLERVLKMRAIDNSLPRAIMAYNAGPGAVSRWSNNIEMSEDTLMLIEAIPVSETREYVKKVMSNLWIYHRRLGQNAPTLERLADDKSPDYEPQDSPRQHYGNGAKSMMR